MEHGNIGRNMLQTTHLQAPNEHTQNSLLKRNEAGDLFMGKVGRLGTPRIDTMFNFDVSRRHALLTKLRLADCERQILFYAPTWRGTKQSKHFDSEMLERDLKALARLDVHVLFRAHHLAERLLRGMVLDNITVIPHEIDSYDILGVTDVLVTDYSSIFFDYLGTNKPIVFYVYDLESYTAERGLYFAMGDLPGELAFDIDMLTIKVNQVLQDRIKDEQQYRDSRLAFAPLEDGRASQRAIDFFFAETDEYVVDNPRKSDSPVLFRHNFTPGPITDILLRKISALNAAGESIAVMFDKTELQNSPERRHQLARLPDSVLRVPRTGSHVVSIEERWNINQYKRSRCFLNGDQELIYRQAYEREIRRCIGTITFRAVVQISDLDTVGVPLLASSKKQSGISYLVSSAARGRQLVEQSALVRWYDEIAAKIDNLL